jgi:hypothetical protein
MLEAYLLQFAIVALSGRDQPAEMRRVGVDTEALMTAGFGFSHGCHDERLACAGIPTEILR